MSEDENSGLTHIIRSAAVILFGMVFARFVGYATRVYIAQAGVEAYALYNLGLAVIVIGSTFALLGLDEGIQRNIPYYIGKKSEKNQKTTISTALKTTLVSSIICTIVSFLLLSNLEVFSNSPLSLRVLFAFCFTIPLFSITKLLSAILFSYKLVPQAITAVEVIEPIARILIFMLFSYLGFQILGVGGCFFLSFTFAAILLTTNTRKKISFKGFDWSLLKLSTPLFISKTTYIFLGRFDILVLGALSSLKDVAIYGVALPTAQLINLFQLSILGVFIPVISELQAGKKDIKPILSRTSKWISLGATPMFTVFAFWGGPLLKLLFGDGFEGANIPLAMLSFAFMIHSISVPAQRVLLLHKKTKKLMHMALFALFLTICLNTLLVPYFVKHTGSGYMGSAIATSTSLLALTVLGFYYCKKETDILPEFRGIITPITIGFISAIPFLVIGLDKMTIQYALPSHLLTYLILVAVSGQIDGNDIGLLKDAWGSKIMS